MISRRASSVAAAATAILALGAGSAVAAPSFAPADQAGIQPGSQTRTQGGQCTSNFVFTDRNDDVYLGQAGHCASTGGQSATNGCKTASRPLGTKVDIEGARQQGTLAYSSWLQMQSSGEQDADACQYNDLALVKLDPSDRANVNPTIPVLGGPGGVVDELSGGATVFSYGNSELRGGIDVLKPKRGFNLGAGGNGWTHTVLTITPGVPGDSGSGFVDRDGHAFGVLSTLQLAPIPGANGVSDLKRMLAYANAKTGQGFRVADGAGAPARPLLGL